MISVTYLKFLKLEMTRLVIQRKFQTNSLSIFSEIGPKFALQIPVPEKPYSHYLKNNDSYQSFFMAPTRTFELYRIMSLKPKKSFGHDGMSSKLLKTLGMSIRTPICTMVNQ